MGRNSGRQRCKVDEDDFEWPSRMKALGLSSANDVKQPKVLNKGKSDPPPHPTLLWYCWEGLIEMGEIRRYLGEICLNTDKTKRAWIRAATLGM